MNGNIMDTETAVTQRNMLWRQVCSVENLNRAVNAAMGYTDPEGHRERLSGMRRRWLARREANVERLRLGLLDGSYGFGRYKAMVVNETKRREIHYHALLEDNIREIAVMQVLEPYYKAAYSPACYGSVKGRGLIKAADRLEEIISAHPEAYYLQTDHRQYYASIDHATMLRCIAGAVPDDSCVEFMRRLLASYSPGIPIGVPSGHHNGNLLLSGIDRWLDSHGEVIGHIRNMDDRVIVVADKAAAHRVYAELEQRSAAIGLVIKPNYRIAPVRCGIDALGFKLYPTHRLVRRRLKLNMRRKANRLRRRGVSGKAFKRALASHYGWCCHADARHLLQVTLGDNLKLYEKMKIQRRSELKPQRRWFGLAKERFISMTDLVGREALLIEWQTALIKGEEKVAVRLCLTDELPGEPTDSEVEAASRYTITRSAVIRDRLAADSDILPFAATFRKVNGRYWCYE